MQDRFVGDIGDFGKYGLLRALTGIHPEAEPRLSLGVVWYYNDKGTGSPGDGQRLSYLDKPGEYEDCDPALYGLLKRIVHLRSRNLQAIEDSGILGDRGCFLNEPVPGGLPARNQWSNAAVAAMATADMVFLDPDKGLAPPTAGRSSPEHINLYEVRPFVERGQTVIIYHHLARSFEGKGASHCKQMRGWAKRLKEKLPLNSEPEILWYRRGTARAYFILSGEEHTDIIARRLDAFRASRWFTRGHFTKLPP